MQVEKLLPFDFVNRKANGRREFLLQLANQEQSAKTAHRSSLISQLAAEGSDLETEETEVNMHKIAEQQEKLHQEFTNFQHRMLLGGGGGRGFGRGM
jgi:hypothetical protein